MQKKIFCASETIIEMFQPLNFRLCVLINLETVGGNLNHFAAQPPLQYVQSDLLVDAYVIFHDRRWNQNQ